MTTFRAEKGSSRKTFYAVRARMVAEPRLRRPKSSLSRVGQDMKQQSLDVRAASERSGLNRGPVSAFDKIDVLGMRAPSIASPSRIFCEAGAARNQPKKKPRASYRQFVHLAPYAGPMPHTGAKPMPSVTWRRLRNGRD